MQRHQKKLVLLFLLSFVLLSANIGGYSIYITDEARNAQCAYEMYERGDLIVPTYNQVLRTDKPPLHYYFMMASYAVFGKTAFAARLFSAIFGALLILLTYTFAARFLGEKSANWSVIVLLSSLGFITQFHLAVPDPYLIFLMAATQISFFYFDQTKTKRYLWLAYISVGFGVLAKGPVAMVLPGIAILGYIIASGKFSLEYIKNLRPLEGILIVLAIAAPWYIAVHIKTAGAWTEGFFIGHNVDRFAAPKEGHGGSFLLPAVFALLTLLPFSVFLPQAVYRSFKERVQPILLYCLLVTLVTVVFFSFASTKLPSYISPIFPFAAIMTGNYLSQLEKIKKSSFLVSIVSFSLISIAIWFAVWKLVPQEKGLGQLTQLHYFFIPLAILGLLVVPLALINKRRLTFLTMSFAFIITHQLFFYFAFPQVDSQNPVAKTMHIVKEAEYLVNYRRMNQAYPFQLNREIKSYSSIEELEEKLTMHPQTIVISRKKYKEDLERLELHEVAREVDILDNTTTIILKKVDQP